ncbi:gag-polypeptide of LTR copia-type [Sesbania bispinosa]|nr:gag-polypeptide of LTR copia-type [Sesbania bispinosa]
MASTLKIEKFTGKNSFNLIEGTRYEVLYEVVEQETTFGLWLKLEKLFMKKSICYKLLLKRRIFGLRMKEGTPLKDHLDELILILIKLRDIDIKMEDEDVAMILLSFLPPSYENFVNSLSKGRIVSHSKK